MVLPELRSGSSTGRLSAVTAELRFYGGGDQLIHQVTGRWSSEAQDFDHEKLHRAPTATILARRNECLDVAFMYPGEGEAYPFNDENRFRGLPTILGIDRSALDRFASRLSLKVQTASVRPRHSGWLTARIKGCDSIERSG